MNQIKMALLISILIFFLSISNARVVENSLSNVLFNVSTKAQESPHTQGQLHIQKSINFNHISTITRRASTSLNKTGPTTVNIPDSTGLSDWLTRTINKTINLPNETFIPNLNEIIGDLANMVSNNLTAEQLLQKLTSLSQPMKTELRRGFDSLVQKGLITVNLLGTNFGEKPMSIIGINLGFNPSSIVGFNLLGGLDPFGSGGGSSVNLFQILLQIINMFLGVGNDLAIGALGKKENIGNLGGKFPLVGNGNSIFGGSISQGHTPTGDDNKGNLEKPSIGAGNLGIFGSPNPLGGILGRH